MTETIVESAIHPFRVDIPEADLDDLRVRLDRARWPDELPGAGSDYGVPLATVRNLAEQWRTGYDWRETEARLNQYPQFTTEIDGQTIHFLHVRSAEPNALPIILTHGWPGSVLEYLDVIGPLTAPRAHGLDPADAFDLVIPSVPGFGFSGPTGERGWDRRRMARAWVELMRRLGYERYGAVGNDGGSFVSPEVGRLDPEHVVGVHVTQVFSFLSGDPAEFAGLSEADLGGLKYLEYFMKEKMAFNQLQSTQPQTLAYALLDSPVGQLAWSAQLLEGMDPQFILDNVTLYWLTRTAGSSARMYWEDNHAQGASTEPTTSPSGSPYSPATSDRSASSPSATTRTSSVGPSTSVAGTTRRTRRRTCWLVTCRSSFARSAEAVPNPINGASIQGRRPSARA